MATVKYPLNKSGFTLIEMLLLIMLLGILFSFTLSNYQQANENSKIDRCAIQILQLLQAGSAFYHDKGFWPTNGSSVEFNTYKPINSAQNPWGGNYDASPNSNKQFVVSSDNIPAPQTKRLASRLPNSTVICNNNVCNLSAQVAAPGGQAPSNNPEIKIIQEVQPNFNNQIQTTFDTASFSCPNNWTPLVQTSINSLTVNNPQDYNCIALGSSPIDQVFSTTGLICPQQANGNYKCTITVTADTVPTDYSPPFTCRIRSNGVSLGNVTVLYIAYCVPPNN